MIFFKREILFLREISYTATLVNPKKMRETPQVLTGSLLTQRQEAVETSNSSVMLVQDLRH